MPNADLSVLSLGRHRHWLLPLMVRLCNPSLKQIWLLMATLACMHVSVRSCDKQRRMAWLITETSALQRERESLLERHVRDKAHTEVLRTLAHDLKGV